MTTRKTTTQAKKPVTPKVDEALYPQVRFSLFPVNYSDLTIARAQLQDAQSALSSIYREGQYASLDITTEIRNAEGGVSQLVIFAVFVRN